MISTKKLHVTLDDLDLFVEEIEQALDSSSRKYREVCGSDVPHLDGYEWFLRGCSGLPAVELSELRTLRFSMSLHGTKRKYAVPCRVQAVTVLSAKSHDITLKQIGLVTETV